MSAVGVGCICLIQGNPGESTVPSEYARRAEESGRVQCQHRFLINQTNVALQ